MDGLAQSMSEALQQLHPLVNLGLLLLLSYIGGEIAGYCRVPRVTGYLVIGMLISPSVSGLLALAPLPVLIAGIHTRTSRKST